MSGHTLSFPIPQEADTAELGRALAKYIRLGDVILLNGPMGAGKTHFARALIQSILIEAEDVPSPSFALVQTYDTHLGPLAHFDLYRLDTADLTELGIDDALDTGITLIEWPDRMGAVPLPYALTLTFNMSGGDDTRSVRMSWTDQRWDVLEGLKAHV